MKLPTYSHVRTIDTTGAGDTYAAGFLYGVAMGLDARTSGEIASCLAGEIISSLGAQFSKEDAARVRDHIEKTYLK